MPDNAGKLTIEENEKVQQWLKQHWKNWACPFSGHTNWELGEYIAQAMMFSGGGLVVGGPTYPLVVLTCAGCGYTVFINAIKAGVVTKRVESDVKP